ncbi:ABC transporter G family member 20-like [Physella acuta]|uniref:ABC transporter G family member 20-like n=1 Tax=Physella acuta TaxID=109671 RepID=UPI0027DBC885|nr:ABC transporter G family member 20-like [Physella acuta]
MQMMHTCICMRAREGGVAGLNVLDTLIKMDIGLAVSNKMNYSEIEHGPMAVYCRGLKKSVGFGKSKLHVLCGLNMSVPHGSIYGLLGASGCGKTTLLKCIIGRLKLNGGLILTLGKEPGSIGHGVPGRRVGYMPQELAVFMNFTIAETFYFFGRLHGMKKSAIESRTNFLIGFLNLPEHDRRIGWLSGGQQRRVSLAAALLQEPELLILDEPTVGVDPVLRERIWGHLFEIAKSSLKTTIIITTHYIEEAAEADRVGLMRGGRLLAEDKPEVLMTKYDLLSLEAVFLHLCHRDRLPNNDDSELLPSVTEALPYQHDQEAEALYRKYPDETNDLHLLGARRKRTDYGTVVAGQKTSTSRMVTAKSLLPSKKNISAVAIKNLISMKRNLVLLSFEFMVPVVQIILFCVCIGAEPRDLRVSICNEDIDDLGSLFLGFLNNKTITKVMRDDIDSAVMDVKMGNSWSAMHIKQNFSLDLITRYDEGLHASNQTIDGSTVWLYMDMSNQQIAFTIQSRVMLAFRDFSRMLLESFGYNPSIASIPVGLAKPVYGSFSTSFTDFMAMGLIVSATFFLACGLTTLVFVLERKEGLMERMIVAGVAPIEIMISHVLTQLLVMFGQVLLMFAIALLVFNMTHFGNIFCAISLVILQGLCGMTLGMVISACCTSENTAIQATLGIMYPSLFLSGTIWPIEAMPFWLRKIALGLPMTYPTYAVRAIMGRGWGFDMTLIWSSFCITIAWIIINCSVAAIILKFKKG